MFQGKHESVESSQALELMSPSSDDCSESSPSASSSASLLSSLLSSSDDCDIGIQRSLFFRKSTLIVDCQIVIIISTIVILQYY